MQFTLEDVKKFGNMEVLAKQMVELSGLTIKNENNQNGDIEIVYTGLRAGEKLYEELLVDAHAISTDHPLIFKAKESLLPDSFLWENLMNLEKELSKRNKTKIFKILKNLVPEWEDANYS